MTKLLLGVSDFELVNVVAGGRLGIELDLTQTVSAFGEFQPTYEPEVAPGLHFALPSSEVTVMLFRTGNYHLTGAKSIDQISEAFEELTSVIESELRLTPDSPNVEIRNLVYKGTFEREFDLVAISGSTELEGDIEYDPETHPGLRYRREGTKGVFTLYRTGSFIYTGENQPPAAEKSIQEFIIEISDLVHD